MPNLLYVKHKIYFVEKMTIEYRIAYKKFITIMQISPCVYTNYDPFYPQDLKATSESYPVQKKKLEWKSLFIFMFHTKIF